MERLHGLVIPKSSKKSSKHQVEINNLKEKKVVDYVVEPLSSGKVEPGELNNMKLIAPQNNSYITGLNFSRTYHIMPEIMAATDIEKQEAGIRARDVEYVPREQPDGMKLQSLPFGFHTGFFKNNIEGKALENSLKRYADTLGTVPKRQKTLDKKEKKSKSQDEKKKVSKKKKE